MPPDPSAPDSPTTDRPWIRELRRGDRISGTTLLVETSNFKQTRNQKYFIQMNLRDRSGSIRAIRWEADEVLYHSFHVDDFLRVSGRIEEFQGNLQLVIDTLERVDPTMVDYDEFLPMVARDLAEMETELRGVVAAIDDDHVRALLSRLIDDPEVLFGLTHCPAGKRLHHAYIGGLLDHILSLVKLANAVADRYDRLDRDILVAGCILHDIGKLEELSFTRNFGYTNVGQLLGHIGLGMLLIDRHARQVPGFPASRLLEIQHIIASHHGELEYGALKQPQTPEAFAVHYLDNLDAKMATLDSIEEELLAPIPGSAPTDGRWSDFKPHLGRRLFFPDRDGNPSTADRSSTAGD